MYGLKYGPTLGKPPRTEKEWENEKSQVHACATSDETSGCKSSSGQGKGEARDNPSKQLEKVKSKKECVLEAQRVKKKVHFATLIDICRLENVELEPKLQKNSGRVVLRGDIAHAVFTEQGSSASQMTAANGCHCKTTRL